MSVVTVCVCVRSDSFGTERRDHYGDDIVHVKLHIITKQDEIKSNISN